MSAAMVALATITLGSSASSVTFGSIPATYRDLRIVFNGGQTQTASLFIRLNSDSSSSAYYDVYMRGNGSTTLSSTDSARSDGARIGFDTSPTVNSNQLNSIIDVMDYSATDKHKSFLSRTNDAGSETGAFAGRWANTTAVTTVMLFLGGSSVFTAGSTFSLYGIVS